MFRRRFLSGMAGLVPCAALALVLAGSGSASAQFNPIKEAQKLGGQISDGAKDLGGKVSNGAKELGKQIDPSVALRKELEDARKKAMKDLKKFDPNEIFKQVENALQQRIKDELKKIGANYDKKTGDIDLRGTSVGKTIDRWVRNFAQGNKGKGQVEEFIFNVHSRKLSLRLHVRHCHSWGKVIPGTGPVDLYSVTQTAKFYYSFKSNSGDFDINFGNWAPRINTKTVKKLKDGDLIAAAEALVPSGAGKLVGVERKNEYEATVNKYKEKHGAGNVYFSKKTFVDWASPETLAKYAVNGVVTAGTSVWPQIMNDLKQRATEELPTLSAWLQKRGASNAEALARELLAGRQPKSPFVKFEMVKVRYSAREKNLNTPWRHVDHLGFVIVWTNGGNRTASK